MVSLNSSMNLFKGLRNDLWTAACRSDKMLAGNKKLLASSRVYTWSSRVSNNLYS
jgi:hypothetical protein